MYDEFIKGFIFYLLYWQLNHHIVTLNFLYIFSNSKTSRF